MSSPGAMNPMEALKGSSASLLRYCNYGILWQCIAPCIAGSVGHLKKIKDLVDDRDWHPPTTGYCTHLLVTVLDFNGFHIFHGVGAKQSTFPKLRMLKV